MTKNSKCYLLPLGDFRQCLFWVQPGLWTLSAALPLRPARNFRGGCSLGENQCRLEPAGRIERGGDVLPIPGRSGLFVNWQKAKRMAASEPRKLFVPVRSRSKQGSNGIPLIAAQTTSPLTRSVPGGRVA